MRIDPTVFVVDDDNGVRDSLNCLLESNGLRCELYASAEDYLSSFDAERPGCMLVDLRMPGIDGLELQRRVSQQGGTLPIIMLTAYGDVPTAVDSLKKGAFDFLQKPYRPVELITKVKQALETDILSRRNRENEKDIQRRLDTLTPREKEILDLVVSGEATKRIARRLGTSYNTVSHQRTKIMRKMGVDSAAQLIRLLAAREL